MMKFKSLFRRSQQGHQKQHRRLRHNNNNITHPQVTSQPQQHPVAPKSSSTISLFKEQPNSRSEGSTLAGAASCWGSVTTLPSPTSAKNHAVKNQTLPKDFDRMQRLEGDVQSSDKILMEKHKTELMWLKEQHRVEMEHLTKEIDKLHAVLRNSNRAETSSESEPSIICLQDRLLQMEEHQFSKNEELQATINELTDLQNQYTELQANNERLTEEKGVLLNSLCRQTEKLEDSRNQVGSLQEALLLKEENAEMQAKGYNTEREQKLVDLLKSAQEERETLLQTQDHLKTEIKNLYTSTEGISNEVNRLLKRVKCLEADVEEAEAEKQHLDLELRKAKQEIANRNMEVSKLNGLVESLRAKVADLEKPRHQENVKNLVDERLDAVRREKEELENQTDSLRKHLSRMQCENERLKGQYAQIQEDFQASKSASRSSLEDAEKRLINLKDEKIEIETELQLVRDSLSEWQAKCQRYMDEKRDLKTTWNELQRRERVVQTRHLDLENTLRSERESWVKERNEWEQFKKDLLMTVRIASDFKIETQNELEKVLVDNKALNDKIRSLEAQLDKFKNLASQKNNSISAPKLPLNTTTTTKDDVITNELHVRRKANAARQDSRLSVKCLIESIENATKQAKTSTF